MCVCVCVSVRTLTVYYDTIWLEITEGPHVTKTIPQF